MFRLPKIGRKLGEADPVFSMGQRAWDLYSTWPVVLAFFTTGGGVSAAAIFTQWARALGPLGILLIALAASLLTSATIAYVRLALAKRRLARVQEVTTSKWTEETDGINPLQVEFHTKRIRLSDLASPIDNRIKGKRFIDCEILGPRIITFIGKGSLNGCNFADCDFVAVRNDAFMQNVTVLEECTVRNGFFWRCTIYVPRSQINVFGFPVPSISLTGDPAYYKAPFPTPPGAPPPSTRSQTLTSLALIGVRY